MLAACDSRYDEFQRLMPADETIPVPAPITITSVENTPGGAVITVAYPDDDNIRGAIATYVRNGVTVNAKVSRYSNVLKVEGFPNTDEREVSVASFNVNEVQSEVVKIKIHPETPAIASAHTTVTQTFGGVKILVEGNEAKADLAVCLLRDADLADAGKPLKDMKWVEVTTLFTSSNNIRLTRRNLEPVEAIYGVYMRDHFGNVSDTTWTTVTPIPENKLNHSTFSDANLADDNCKSANNSNYPVKALWDDSGASSVGHFFASDYAPRPSWLTINFGYYDSVNKKFKKRVQLSRIHTLPRIDYTIWANAHPRIFEFWGWIGDTPPTGAEAPLRPNKFEEGWVCLGRFEQFKPSGYAEDGSVGETTPEDREYFNSGNDFEFDSDEYEHANDFITYLRCVFVDTFATYGTEATSMAVQIGEITPYGNVIDVD